MTPSPGRDRPTRAGLETTAELFSRAQAGDAPSRERLIARYLSRLRSFARGRVPLAARSVVDTDDMVQTTLLRGMKKLDSFDARTEGAFLAYLRQILVNRVRDHARSLARRPGLEPFSDSIPGGAPDPPEEVERKRREEVLDAALEHLSEEHREAVILRTELGLSYQEIADAMGRASPDAARKLVARAMSRLADALPDDPREP